MFVVDQEAAGTEDAGVALLQAFNYIAKQHSGSKALSFITDVCILISSLSIRISGIMNNVL